MGQFAHVIRRNLNMCYIIENNGVYGLTKGQYSASADVGSVAKKGTPNKQMLSKCRSIPSALRSGSVRPILREAFRATSNSSCP
jgi:pyruvate/2-oxoacid:ferredoxin oxidoreductase beta subunit